MVLSVCGARLFFNFNPFLKLDGYYLLSDWLEVPNLRQRAWDYGAHLRWLLWGRGWSVSRGEIPPGLRRYQLGCSL